MAELTDAEKQAMIDQAMGSVGSPVGEVLPEPEKVATAVHAPSRAAQGISEWGPYDDYVLVTTPYGQFAVPKGEILHFEAVQTFSKRAGTMIEVHQPVYRSAATGLTRHPLTGEFYDPELVKV